MSSSTSKLASNQDPQPVESDVDSQQDEMQAAYARNTLTFSRLGNLVKLAKRVDMLECVMEFFPGGIVLYDKDLNMVMCNEELKKILEYPDSLFENGLPNMAEVFRFNAERGEYGDGDAEKIVEGKMSLVGEMIDHEYERERPNGTVVQVRGVSLPDGGFLTTYTDVTKQHQHVRQLQALLDNFPGGISLFDKDLKMVLINEQNKEIHDYDEELFEDENDLPTLEEMFRYNAKRGEYGEGDVEEQVSSRMELAEQKQAHTYDRKRPNGTVLEIRGVPLEGSGFLTTYRDVTELRKNQEKVIYLAHHDVLTGLPNRLLLKDRLHQSIALAKRGHMMALHCIDLDKFKPVNDIYGHAIGDELLKQVAERFNSIKRDTDTIARTGGDEFVIVQVGINDRAGAEILAERVIKTLRAPYEIDGHTIEISASIGIALAPTDATNSDALFKLADAALYDSKANGRNCFKLYDGRDEDCIVTGKLLF
ncbi:MAG: PAS-domain containing protein [Rhizobiaceae bacterium]|nr:PAS-domain containing protein [Rhizobiaceae bacterium]